MTNPVLRLDAINAADICGEKTRMRPMRPDEAAIIHSWNNDPDVYQFWGSYDYRYKSLDEFLAETVGDSHFFDGSAVAEGRCFSIEPLNGPNGGTVIGMINTNKIDVPHRSTEIDVVIGHPGYRERGYGSDAIREFLRFLFDTVGLHRAWLGTYEYNARARHVYEKLGFVQEGIMRESDYVDGRWVDSVVYGILEDEFRRANPQGRGTPRATASHGRHGDAPKANDGHEPAQSPSRDRVPFAYWRFGFPPGGRRTGNEYAACCAPTGPCN